MTEHKEITGDDLDRALSIIGAFGVGFHTYPGSDDNQQKIYESCLQLERQGEIERCTDEPGHVVWQVKAKHPS